VLLNLLFAEDAVTKEYFKTYRQNQEGSFRIGANKREFDEAKTKLLNAIDEHTQVMTKTERLKLTQDQLAADHLTTQQKLDEINKEITATQEAAEREKQIPDKATLELTLNTILTMCSDIFSMGVWKQNLRLTLLSKELKEEIHRFRENNFSSKAKMNLESLSQFKMAINGKMDEIGIEVEKVTNVSTKLILTILLNPLGFILEFFVSLAQKLLTFLGTSTNPNAMFTPPSPEEVSEKLQEAKKAAGQLPGPISSSE